MRLSRRLALFLLFAAGLLLAGLLFWPFILNDIINPAALVVWLFLRIFVLSIGQNLYWMAIIFVALVFLARLLSQGQVPLPKDESLDLNDTINTLRYWRLRFSLTDGSLRDDRIIRRELADMLASFYAAQQHLSTNFETYDALKRGQIPLPEHLHTFLFPEEPQRSGHSIKKLLRSIREIPRRSIHRWTGRERAEQYRMIEEVLGFLETSLEIKNDEREFTPNEH